MHRVNFMVGYYKTWKQMIVLFVIELKHLFVIELEVCVCYRPRKDTIVIEVKQLIRMSVIHGCDMFENMWKLLFNLLIIYCDSFCWCR